MEAGGSILPYIDLTMCVGKLLSLTLYAALETVSNINKLCQS